MAGRLRRWPTAPQRYINIYLRRPVHDGRDQLLPRTFGTSSMNCVVVHAVKLSSAKRRLRKIFIPGPSPER